KENYLMTRTSMLLVALLTLVALETWPESEALATKLSAPDKSPPPASRQRFVAIDNVCAWPNLTRLRDGTLIATIFNQPSHGKAEGDVECWASTDGRFWTKRGTAAPHEPSANRMNVAAGAAGD